MQSHKTEHLITKTDSELQVAFGEVYSPGYPDSQGDFMTKEDIREAAYKFLAKKRQEEIDVEHNGETDAGLVVESFIARKGDPDFLPDSWVVAVHVPDEDLWEKIKSGEINGFSMEALVKSKKKILTFDVPDVIKGKTEEHNDHSHTFELKFDSKGRILVGKTNEVNGHSHEIRRGTATEVANDHTHRYSFKEFIDTGVNDEDEE